jgi:predicted lipoprotein with Yx(FWY)xxD motif
MSKSSTVWIVVIAVIVIGGLWWLANMGGAPTAAPVMPLATTGQPAATSGAAATQATLDVAMSPTLGAYLTATNGMTLYKFAKDAANVSNCTSKCAVIWPPYIVSSTAGLVGGAGITGNIGTITRADGTLQVTYNSVPLYFYQPDVKPGDTTGQGVMGLWTVVSP